MNDLAKEVSSWRIESLAIIWSPQLPISFISQHNLQARIEGQDICENGSLISKLSYYDTNNGYGDHVREEKHLEYKYEGIDWLVAFSDDSMQRGCCSGTINTFEVVSEEKICMLALLTRRQQWVCGQDRMN